MIDTILAIVDLPMAITNLFLTMGLPVIDESLEDLLSAMQSMPKTLKVMSLVRYSKLLGSLLGICVMSYECWIMIMGRRVFDFFKLLRIFGLSCCISACDGFIIPALQVVPNEFETRAKALAMTQNANIATLEKELAKKQGQYLDTLRSAMGKSKQAEKAAEEAAEDESWFDSISASVSSIGDTINRYAKQAVLVVESFVVEIINDVIRFIGELIFQMSYYGLLVAQRCMLAILAMFGPLMFALSIVPPWASAWSQWISKYLSISLWGGVVYICLYYAEYIIKYELTKDIAAYDAIIANATMGEEMEWGQVFTLGIQGIGSCCMYCMAMLVGAKVIGFAPEIASWLIPGGASSSIGSAMSSTASGAVMGTAAVAGGVALTTVTGGAGGAIAGGVQGLKTGYQMGSSGPGSATMKGTAGTAMGAVGAIGGAAAGAISGGAGSIGKSAKNAYNNAKK